MRRKQEQKANLTHGKIMLSSNSLSSPLAQYYPSTWNTTNFYYCHLLFYQVSLYTFFVSSFRLPPHLDPYIPSLAPSFCLRDLKQIPSSSQCSVYKLTAVFRTSTKQFSHLYHFGKVINTCKHVHVGICMSLYANTHIHKRNTPALPSIAIKANHVSGLYPPCQMQKIIK